MYLSKYGYKAAWAIIYLVIKIISKGGRGKAMAKTRRGKTLKRDGYERGTCPICNKTRVKLAWEVKNGDKRIRICKVCNARILNGKMALN